MVQPLYLQPLAWQWFQCQIPADWEVTAYHTRPEKGRLLLETRAGPQAEVAWEISPDGKEPDLVQTLEAGTPDNMDKPNSSGWGCCDRVGVFLFPRPAADQLMRSAIGYLAHATGTLRWTFLDAATSAEVIRGILCSCAENTGTTRRWVAWGLDCQIPEHYSLKRALVQPANVSLEFADPQHQQLTVSRFGLPDLLLGGGSLSNFHRRWLAQMKQLAESMEPGTLAPTDQDSVATFRAPAPSGIRSLVGRSWTGHSRIRRSASEPRLHGLTQLVSPKNQLLNWEDVFHAC